jgi:membrane-associated protease RseP (regulator of RpoE activity)
VSSPEQPLPLSPEEALRPSDTGAAFALEPIRWKLPLALFVATLASTFYVGAGQALRRTPWEIFEQHRAEGLGAGARAFGAALARGWTFALPLLGILLCHEFGHYLMARRHRVRSSLPMFIPAPNLFGTMGAVISMKGRIKTRDALVDIGAAGPLAGLAVALPVTVVGLWLSRVEPVAGREGFVVEGDSLLYLALKRAVCGPIPEGHDVWLHPVAFAGWAGLFVTMMNLLPIGQLDGGHVAYALFGIRHDRWSRGLAYALLGFAALVGAWIRWRSPGATFDSGAYAPAVIWAVWALVARGVLRLSGDQHPPTTDDPLSPVRRRVAAFTLACFLLLFMPLPIRLA